MSREQVSTHDWWGMECKCPRSLPAKVGYLGGACSHFPLEFPNRSKQAPTAYSDNLLNDTTLIEFLSFSFLPVSISLPIPLPVFSGIISQIKSLHSIFVYTYIFVSDSASEGI